jgi:hypothetical protein
VNLSKTKTTWIFAAQVTGSEGFEGDSALRQTAHIHAEVCRIGTSTYFCDPPAEAASSARAALRMLRIA